MHAGEGLKIREFVEEREQRLRPLDFINSSKSRKKVHAQEEAQLSSDQAEEEIWTVGFPCPGSSRRVHSAGQI